ncbi:MAG: HD domain-containing protein [Alphaproteobacteria bacterium]|nr:HD domain-containing protein [Alphaproteobacteria bacterium]
MEKKQVQNLVNLIGRMKSLKRAGWVKRHVKSPESDADHSYSLALLALLLAPDNLDLLKCLKLALIHDLPEAFCGDFIPGEIEPQEKAKLETSAMQKVVDDIKHPELMKLFEEYQQHSTPEAEFVWTLDRLDNVFTARFYEDRYCNSLTDEFAAATLPRIESLKDKNLGETLQKILKALD